MLQLMREGCSYMYPPLSIARYLFIQLNEQEQCRVKTLAQCFNTAAHDSTQGPLNHCALQITLVVTVELTPMWCNSLLLAVVYLVRWKRHVTTLHLLQLCIRGLQSRLISITQPPNNYGRNKKSTSRSADIVADCMGRFLKSSEITVALKLLCTV